jgi:hypothetical protein
VRLFILCAGSKPSSELHNGHNDYYDDDNDASFYVKNVDLILTIWKMKEKTIETDGRKLLLDGLKLGGIGRRDRIPNYRGIFQF